MVFFLGKHEEKPPSITDHLARENSVFDYFARPLPDPCKECGGEYDCHSLACVTGIKKTAAEVDEKEAARRATNCRALGLPEVADFWDKVARAKR